MATTRSLKRLGFIVLILFMQNLWAQPHPLWDIELDVTSIYEGSELKNGDFISVNIEITNCSSYDCNLSADLIPSYLGGEVRLDYGGLEAVGWTNMDPNGGNLMYFYDVGFPCFGIVHGSPLTVNVRITDITNAYLTAEISEIHSSFRNLGYCREPGDWLEEDSDSTPDNGVDTDGDGDFTNDPDDEDDGDGIVFADFNNTRKPIECRCEEADTYKEPVAANPEVVGESAEGSSVGSGGLSTVGNPTPPGGTNPLGNPATPGSAPSGTLNAEAGCMIGANVPSPMAPNPEGTEGIFRFDYKIESIARASFIDDGRRQTMDLNVNYYVNSNDGSLFFSTQTGGFFGANAFATSSRMGRIDGVVQKADGQQVIYGLENPTSTLRAVVVAQDQTAADVAGKKQLNVREFMNSLGSTTRSPDPLPPHLLAKWGDVPGYVGRMNDVSGTKSTVTIYMGRSPDINPIPTNSPLVGFLVGIFKDNVQANCNKLAFYTRMNLDGSDDYLEVELVHIEPASLEFNGTPYKLTQLGAVPGSTARTRMQALQGQMEALAFRKEAAKTARRNCAPNDTACYDQYTRQIEQLESELENLECQIACDMGLEEYADNCTCP